MKRRQSQKAHLLRNKWAFLVFGGFLFCLSVLKSADSLCRARFAKQAAGAWRMRELKPKYVQSGNLEVGAVYFRIYITVYLQLFELFAKILLHQVFLKG